MSDYDEGYERGHSDALEEGHKSGFEEGKAEGFDSGYETAEKEFTNKMEDEIDILRRKYNSRICEMNSRIESLRQEIYELRMEHATITRTISKSTG